MNIGEEVDVAPGVFVGDGVLVLGAGVVSIHNNQKYFSCIYRTLTKWQY